MNQAHSLRITNRLPDTSLVAANTQALPEDHRNNVRWLHRLMLKNGTSLGQAAKAISDNTRFTIDKGTISKLLNGKHEGSLQRSGAAIAAYRRLVVARAKSTRIDFVNTSLAKRILAHVDHAAAHQTVVNIFGEPQVGKTVALQHAAKVSNIGQVIYFLVPVAERLYGFTQRLGHAVGVSKRTQTEMRIELEQTIDSSYTILFDEVHNIVNTYRPFDQVAVFEFIRQLGDITGCGVVYCGTNVWKNALEQGTLKKILSQTRQRGVLDLNLEAKPLKKDVSLIVHAFGLPKVPTPEAAAILDQARRHDSLSRIVDLLKNGANFAGNQNETYTWQHFVEAFEIIHHSHN